MSKSFVARLTTDEERQWNRLISKTFVHLTNPSRRSYSKDSRVHVSSRIYDFDNVSNQDMVLGNMLLQNQEIPFIQLRTSANINTALKQMIATWDMYVPRVVLVLRSDMCFLTKENKTKLEKKLVNSIMDATFNVHNMWICTHGLNAEFSKAMGEAFNVVNTSRHMHFVEKYSDIPICSIKTPLIGICEKNVFKHCKRQFRKYDVLETEQIYCEQADLNPYHSHFVFVSDDNYPAMNYDYFFSKLECSLRDSQEPSSTVKTRVPIIALLVGGKETCIEYLLLHVQQSLPVLVVYGSGGLADIIAFAYFEINRSGLRSSDKEYRENLLKPILCKKISITFPDLDEKLYDYIIDSILKCIWVPEKGSLEYVYILDAHDHSMELERLPYHMLCALFKSQRRNIVDWHLQMKSDLLLTIDWNCPDVALSEVFLRYPRFTVPSLIFESVLFTKGREPFVSLFLQRGFKVHKFLTANQLVSFFQKSKDEIFFHNVCWKGLMECEEGTEVTVEFIDVVLSSMIEFLTNIPFRVSSEELNLNAIGIYSTEYDKCDDSVLAEQKALSLLILWALISNRIKLANVLVCYTGMPVMLAFICSIVLNHLLPYVAESSIRVDISTESKHFCEVANGVFSKAYDVAPDRAWKLLSEQNPIWADLTLPKVALMCQNYIFLSHECFQKWATRMYMGKIRMRELIHEWFQVSVHAKIMLSAFLIVPMYFWIGFEHGPALSEKQFSNVVATRATQGATAKENSDKSAKTLPTTENREKKLSDLKPYSYNLSLWKKILLIWKTPITKFWTSYVLYVLFLILFCLTTIWPSCGLKYLEYALCIWIASLIMENIHCFYVFRKIYSQKMFFLKCFEIIYMIVFIVFLLFNRLYEEKTEPYARKVILCFGLLFFHYRAMYTYMPVSSTLGPLLFRIKTILFVDFMHFLCLIFFVMISNGIVLEALMFPDYPYSLELVRRFFQNAWIQLFLAIPYRISSSEVRCEPWAQIPVNGTACDTRNYFNYDCPHFDIWSFLIMFHYMILSKLVFTPMIFAITVAAQLRLRTESEQHWNAYRYLLISEYSYCVSLPPPFNLIYYLMCALKYISSLFFRYVLNCKSCCQKRRKSSAKSKPYTFGHYSFWKQVVLDYIDEQENIKRETQYSKDKLNMISEMREAVKDQEKTVYKARSQVAELESDVTYTRLFVQTSRYWIEEDNVLPFSIHLLSRHTPYPGTKIERCPVPDKYVPWDVKWLSYMPATYTAPSTDFPEHLQHYADRNIFRTDLPEDFTDFDERHEMRWNMNYTDSNGVYKRRRSWIKYSGGQNLIYMLSHGMPQNPEGRTGLSGKGSLLQWGPNHHVFVIITKFKNLLSSGQLEFVAVNARRNVLSLPGGFARSVNRYLAIQDCFDADWETETGMLDFFKKCILKRDGNENVKCRTVMQGYMDNTLNTDNAWKEIQLWHIHYSCPTNIHTYFKPELFWCTIDDKVFRKLNRGQGSLLKEVMQSLSSEND